MEIQPLPNDHLSYLYANQFEKEYKITNQLGLQENSFGKLTILYLANHTLRKHILELRQKLNHPGVKFWETYYPSLYTLIYRTDIKDLIRCTSAKEQNDDHVIGFFKDLPPHGVTYATRLKDSLKSMCTDQVIQNEGYRLFITDENLPKIPQYRIS